MIRDEESEKTFERAVKLGERIMIDDEERMKEPVMIIFVVVAVKHVWQNHKIRKWYTPYLIISKLCYSMHGFFLDKTVCCKWYMFMCYFIFDYATPKEGWLFAR